MLIICVSFIDTYFVVIYIIIYNKSLVFELLDTHIIIGSRKVPIFNDDNINFSGYN